MPVNKRNKIFIIITAAVLLVVVPVYIYTRYHLLRAKDFKPDNYKATSVTDLRPALIAKLQQLVKDGSGGLYHLSIEQIDPDVLASAADVNNATLMPDSAALKHLDSLHLLPDDIFKISFSKLHITGIGITDLLSKRNISLKNIIVVSPVIELYKNEKWYNKNRRINNDTSTLYHKLAGKIESISIDSIVVKHGTFISHEAKKKPSGQLKDVAIKMSDILIDSTTQYDTKRFLFAREATLSTKNLYGRTADSLYYYTCKSVIISTADNKLTAENIELHPRGNKHWFESHLTNRKEMYNVNIPTLTLSGINWWNLTNKKNIIAKEAAIYKGNITIFLDRSLPFRKVKINNYPHQLLMRLPIPVSITLTHIRHAKLSYSEYNPGMAKTGTIYIDDMNGTVSNITNIPGEIKKHSMMVMQSTGLFMHKIPITDGFHFDLSKYKTGNFTMDLNIGNIDRTVLNPITTPLGEFELKRGSIQKGIAHVIGDNFKGAGHGELLYRNLYLVGLKKDADKASGIKKKSVLSFIGNALLIKNNNPSRGESARAVPFDFTRKPKTTFFSLVWGTIFLGILKTIGLPPSFADKSY